MFNLWFIFTIVFGFIFYALFDFSLIILAIIIGMILSFAFILLIGRVQMLIEKSKLKLNVWVFPIAEFRNFYVAIMGKIPASFQKESDYQRAVLIAEKVLEHNCVDRKYYERYTSREFLTSCLAEIKLNKNTYPAHATYTPYDWELTTLTDSTPNISEKKLIGRDKYVYHLEKAIITCRYEIEQHKQAKERLDQGYQALYQGGKLRESSAAIHAGIANAIAGPVAGLATAIKVESENIAIRQHNEDLKTSIAKSLIPAHNQNTTNLISAEKNLNGLIKARTEASVRLVDSSNPHDLLAQINPTAIIREISGDNVKISITVHAIPNLKIYGNIPATVDGSLLIQLKTNGQCVGTTICYFPLDGICKDTVRLTCHCSVNVLSDNYQIEILPDHLWAIENWPIAPH